jgi:hypothetical protein
MLADNTRDSVSNTHFHSATIVHAVKGSKQMRLIRFGEPGREAPNHLPRQELP